MNVIKCKMLIRYDRRDGEGRKVHKSGVQGRGLSWRHAAGGY